MAVKEEYICLPDEGDEAEGDEKEVKRDLARKEFCLSLNYTTSSLEVRGRPRSSRQASRRATVAQHSRQTSVRNDAFRLVRNAMQWHWKDDAFRARLAS